MKADKFANTLKEYFSDKEGHLLYKLWIKDHLLKVGIPTKELHIYLQNVIQYIKQRYNIEGNKLLDLGCGMGEFAVFLALQGYDVVGIDMDEKQLKIARVLSEENGRVAKFIRRDATDLPFADEKFNLVICFDIFEHIENLTPVLKELYRVTEKNSAIFVRFPNKLKLVDDHTGLSLLPLLPKKTWGLYLNIFGKNRKYYQEGLGIHYRTCQNVLKIAIKCGFVVEILPPQLMYPALSKTIKNVVNRFPSLLPSIGPYFHLVFLKKPTTTILKPSVSAAFIENLIWPIVILNYGFLSRLKGMVTIWET